MLRQNSQLQVIQEHQLTLVLEQALQVQESVLEELVVLSQILSLLWEVEIHTEEWEEASEAVCHQVWVCQEQEVKCQAQR